MFVYDIADLVMSRWTSMMSLFFSLMLLLSMHAITLSITGDTVVAVVCIQCIVAVMAFLVQFLF
jgi:hypothetical protein